MTDDVRHETHDKATEHVDPITGEVSDLEKPVRYRIRDQFLDDRGREIPDPRPLQPPVGYKKQPSMFEMIREAVTREHALYAANREPESLEESDDFDIPDDPVDPHSPWENDFDPPWSEVRQAIEDDRKQKAAAAAQPQKEPAEPARPPSPNPEPAKSGSTA